MISSVTANSARGDSIVDDDKTQTQVSLNQPLQLGAQRLKLADKTGVLSGLTNNLKSNSHKFESDFFDAPIKSSESIISTVSNKVIENESEGGFISVLKNNSRAYLQKNGPELPLDDKETHAIEVFCRTAGYRSINERMRNASKFLKPEETDTINTIISGLNKHFSANHAVLYRGLRFNANEYDQFVTKIEGAKLSKQHFIDPAFMSTSLKSDTARNFIGGSPRGVLLQIHTIKENSAGKVLGISNLATASIDLSEREVLFKPGTEFKILESSKIDSGNGDVYFVKLQEVDRNSLQEKMKVVPSCKPLKRIASQ